MGWDLWDGAVRGGDGARQDTPARVSLFHNPKAAARQERQRARDAGRKAQRQKAMTERRIKQMRREEAAGRDSVKPKSSWW